MSLLTRSNPTMPLITSDNLHDQGKSLLLSTSLWMIKLAQKQKTEQRSFLVHCRELCLLNPVQLHLCRPAASPGLHSHPRSQHLKKTKLVRYHWWYNLVNRIFLRDGVWERKILIWLSYSVLNLQDLVTRTKPTPRHLDSCETTT